MRAVALLLLPLLLGGCATKYQEMGLTGGVSAEPILSDTYRIVARGNAYTSRNTVQDYALLKAAETARDKGQTHFQFIGLNDATSYEIGSTPGRAQSRLVGATLYTTYRPGMTYDITKPGQDLYIRVFKPKAGEALPNNSFSAQEILANVGARVQRSE